jgi:hypothetical protein
MGDLLKVQLPSCLQMIREFSYLRQSHVGDARSAMARVSCIPLQRYLEYV